MTFDHLFSALNPCISKSGTEYFCISIITSDLRLTKLIIKIVENNMSMSIININAGIVILININEDI